MRSCCRPSSPVPSRRKSPPRPLAHHPPSSCASVPTARPWGTGRRSMKAAPCHCFTLAGGLPLLALALLALLFPPRAPARAVFFTGPRRICNSCRAGRSRAPPLPGLTASTVFDRAARHASALRHARDGRGRMTLRVAHRRAVCAGAFALILGSPAFAHHPGGASNTGGARAVSSPSRLPPWKPVMARSRSSTSTSASAGSAMRR